MLKISIIMACYNCTAYLSRSVMSVLNQTYKNWELICVDDGSTDGTYDKLLGFSRQDNRIKAFTKKHSGMAAPNRNYALEFISGDFIFVLDSDDEINPECLSECVKRYEELKAKDIDVDIIIPKLVFLYPNQAKKRTICGIVNQCGSESKILDGKKAFSYSLDWRISGLGMYKTILVKKLKWYEEGMNGDEYSTREFFINSRYIAFAKNGVYIYYQNEDSVTKKLSIKLFDTFKGLYKLETLAKSFNMFKDIIKKINQDRYKMFYSLQELYCKNKHNFNNEEKNQIERYLDENQKLLKPYRIIRDYFFRKERDKMGKSIVLFHKIKFYYKRLENA
ncbi:glycosyltransferase family 2 protein [Campylobacter coli]|nr:glycosyltransferase family 2 protein [Campylobacter coli]